MSATVDDSGPSGSGSSGGPKASEDQKYFQAIERTFIRLRGAPFLLSPADWQTARKWRRKGVPLDLVERILESVFEKRRERGAKGITRLSYCNRAIEGAWEEVRELKAVDERSAPDTLDLEARLRALGEALPERLVERESFIEKIASSVGEGGSEAVEAALARLDREVVDAARRSLDAEGRAKLAEAVEKAVAAVARRLPAAQVEQARGRLEEGLLREQLALPVLSLFAPEAEAG